MKRTVFDEKGGLLKDRVFGEKDGVFEYIPQV